MRTRSLSVLSIAAALLLALPAFAQTATPDSGVKAKKQHTQSMAHSMPPAAMKQQTQSYSRGSPASATKQQTQSLAHPDGTPAGVVKQN